MRRGRSRFGGKTGVNDAFVVHAAPPVGSRWTEPDEKTSQPEEQGRTTGSWNSEMFIALWDAVVRLRSKGVHHPVRLIQRPDVSPPEATIFWEDGPSVDVVRNILSGHIGERTFRSGERFNVRLERTYSKEALETGKKTLDCSGDEKALFCVMDGRSFYSAKRMDVIEKYKPAFEGLDKEKGQSISVKSPSETDNL